MLLGEEVCGRMGGLFLGLCKVGNGIKGKLNCVYLMLAFGRMSCDIQHSRSSLRFIIMTKLRAKQIVYWPEGYFSRVY